MVKIKSGGGSKPLINKGFTLIELLAVIAILAIVLLITIPTVLNVIERARIGAFRDSVISVIKAGETYIALEEKSFDEIDIFHVELDFSNKEQFKEGTLIYEDERILAENIMNDRYCANGIKSNLIITKGDCYAVSLEVLELKHNQIKVKAKTTFDSKEIERYQYSRDNGVTWSAEQNTDTYTFTGVEASKYHNVIVKVITKGNVGNLSRVEEVFTPLPPMIEIAGGPRTLAFMGISVDNEVYTWGRNQEIPTKVEGMPKAKAIAVGYSFYMAISLEGDLYTWGSNGSGQLGNGNQIDSATPIKITSLGKVKVISAGADHSMAITETNELYTWGYNQYGQLGIGVMDVNAHSTPVKITSVGSVKDIKAGVIHSFAITTSGTLYGFGYNGIGELGLNNRINYPTPTQVSLSGIGTIKSISTGSQMSGIINTNGEVFFTGFDNVGNYINTFTKINGINSAKQMVQGVYHTAILLENGEIWSFGYNNAGQLGTGNTTNSDVLVKSHTIENAKSIAGNLSTVAVLTTDNSVYTWGDNSNNQLGNGVYNFVKISTKINIPSIDKISAKTNTILVKTTSNDLYSWGANNDGQLGNGDIITQRTPVKITSVGKIKDVVTSILNSAVIKEDNTVYTFGTNAGGALGQGTWDSIPHPTPGKLSVITSAKKMFYGNTAGYTINSDDYLYSWGWNEYGKLGQVDTANLYSPTRISSIGTVKTVGTTYGSAVALDSNNDLWHMGSNINGTAGNGTFDTNNHETPTKINTQLKFREVVGNNNGAYIAITTTGEVYVWGQNALGTDTCFGNSKCFKNLTKVNGLSNIRSITTNGSLFGAIDEEGVLYLWGAGFYGDNDISKTITTPTKINHITNVKQVEIMTSGTVLVVKEDGSLYAWGHNGYGQLGNGFTVFSTNPIQIVK